MKTYKVIYTETIAHTFYVEANSEEEADKIFREKSMECELDFSGGDVIDTGYVIDDMDKPEWEEPDCDDDYIPSSTNGDYSPSDPWNAPGNCIADFISGVQ